MEIEILTQNLTKTIVDTLEENKRQNEKIWKLYVQKMGEYVRYLSSKKDMPATLKHQPYLSLQNTRELKEALESIRIHVGTTIRIEDREYRQLLAGISNVRAGGIATISALEEESYEE